MNLKFCLLFLLWPGSSLHAQYTLARARYPAAASAYLYQPMPLNVDLPPYKRKLFQRNHGAIIGIQRGARTFFELGGEAHWRKISLRKPHIIGATANMEYNFGSHIMGYKAGAWFKRGRVNLTYGANLLYFTDFDGRSRYGLGPSVGFRLLGFHLVNGLNILGGDKELDKVNTLYISLRYYFPVENKFTWDRQTMKKKERAKKEKAKAKEKKRKEREKEREENPSFLDRLKNRFKKQEEPEEVKEEKPTLLDRLKKPFKKDE